MKYHRTQCCINYGRETRVLITPWIVNHVRWRTSKWNLTISAFLCLNKKLKLERWLTAGISDIMSPAIHSNSWYMWFMYYLFLKVFTFQFFIWAAYLAYHGLRNRVLACTLSNKNPSAWNFLSLEPEVTWGTVAIIIRVVLLSPYLRIRGVSLSSIHYNQSRRVYINRRQQYICLIWN